MPIQAGTIRYNTPAESYARFNVHTSTSMPLPFVYRKSKQREPEMSRSLTFDDTELTVGLDAGHIALRPTIMPKTTTDKRIRWSIDNEKVATVNGGYVTLVGLGTTNISAATVDGGADATLKLTVAEPTGISATGVDAKKRTSYKILDGNSIVIYVNGKKYGVNGINL